MGVGRRSMGHNILHEQSRVCWSCSVKRTGESGCWGGVGCGGGGGDFRLSAPLPLGPAEEGYHHVRKWLDILFYFFVFPLLGNKARVLSLRGRKISLFSFSGIPRCVYFVYREVLGPAGLAQSLEGPSGSAPWSLRRPSSSAPLCSRVSYEDGILHLGRMYHRPSGISESFRLRSSQPTPASSPTHDPTLLRRCPPTARSPRS